jgi:hypothetical protein
VVCPGSGARAAQPELWTILPFATHGVDPTVAATFGSLIADELRGQRSARVIPSSAKEPCPDVPCAREAGFAVGAWHVVYGSLGSLGKKTVASVTILDLDRDTVRSHRLSVERIEGLDAAAARLVAEMGPAAPPPTAALTHPRVPPRRRASFLGTAGRVLTFTFGGLALATGTALLSVGLGVEKNGFIYGGVPSTAVGAGLFALGLVAAPEGGPRMSRGGRAISYTMGGLALATGTTLLSVGLGIDSQPMTNSAIPSLIGGGALIMVGIFSGGTRKEPTAARVAVFPTVGGVAAVARF